MSSPTGNRRIFIIVFVVFVLAVIAFAIDMGRRTTAPWNKPKQLERALPGALPSLDTLMPDSLPEQEFPE